MVRLPSGVRYWTVLDEELAVVPVADSFLRQVRFGRDGAESTTKAYAGGVALFLRWCARSGRSWEAGAGQLGLFMTWLAHAGRAVSGADAPAGAAVLAGPGTPAVRSARRINAVLAAVRGMVVHAVAEGGAPGHLVQVLYEVADDRDLPPAACGEDGGAGWRMRARHRLHEPVSRVDRADDGDVVAVLAACGSARDRLIVVLMVRAGLRRGEVLGLRRSDVHLLADSRELGCGIVRPHLHVVRREGNPNGAIAKSRRQRAVPLDFLTVQAFDTYEFERMTIPAAASGDFVFVNLFRGTVGAPMRLDAVNELVGAAARRAGIDPAPRPHQLRHAFASNVQVSGVASDASFGSRRERALPAAQRAALRFRRLSGLVCTRADLGLHEPAVPDATMMRLVLPGRVHHRCGCWYGDASKCGRLRRVHHGGSVARACRGAATGRIAAAVIATRAWPGDALPGLRQVPGCGV